MLSYSRVLGAYRNLQVGEVYLSPFACIPTCYTCAGPVLVYVSFAPVMAIRGCRLQAPRSSRPPAVQSGTHPSREDINTFSYDAYATMAVGIPRAVQEYLKTQPDWGGGSGSEEEHKWCPRDRDRPGQSKASDSSTTTGWSSNRTAGESTLPEHSAKDIDVVCTYRNPVSKTRWGS